MLAPRCHKGGGLLKTWGPSSRTRSSLPHPHHATLCSPCWQAPTSRKVGKVQWSQTGLGPRKKWVLPSTGSTSLEWPLDKCVPVPDDGKLCPLDISAGVELSLLETELGPSAA